MYTNQTIIGRWNAVEQQRRTGGEWLHEYCFEPGEWVLGFYLNGRFSETFQPTGITRKIRTGGWILDSESGLILFNFDELEYELTPGIVFDPIDTEADSAWLYYFENMPDIHFEREEVITRHAPQRFKLETERWLPALADGNINL